ncbi:MAG: GDSL-type esterase/lipase family protein [Ruminococcus sp.]|nr:GDSL-type esterase/lipase family protein [Ruminococcus sp.]MCM1381302.1 GDSL-type esterase/lipase family protein [Muribaculaceae bacterium]MCM1480325.1 GDSL-type esterase/lipase family protein [Muribaculaceae bacterium]
MMITQKEKKKAKFRFSFIVLFIFASFAVCFVLYMKEDFSITPEMLEDASDAVVYIDPVGESSAVINPVPEGERQEDGYFDDAVFIGGKALSGLADYGYVKSENMIISDDITLANINTVMLSDGSPDNEEGGITAADTVIGKSPAKLYIMLGINDLDRIDSPDLFNGLESFIGSVKESLPNVKIYLMPLLPVSAEMEGRIAANADIDAYNSRLLRFADRLKVCYIDVNTGFKGNDGRLPASAAELNGIKLKKEGYGKLAEYILTHTAS